MTSQVRMARRRGLGVSPGFLDMCEATEFVASNNKNKI